MVNVTADQVGTFLQGGTANVGFATNSIFTATPMTGITSSAYCDVYSTNTGLFQPVGAASYYLVNNSTNQGSGTTSGLSAALLADLAGRTTWPPAVLSGWLTNSTNLSVQAPRNTGTPDRGYHYFPIDWALNASVSNTAPITITVPVGVSLATYSTASNQYGIDLFANASFNCQGTATSPNFIVAYNTVQEQSNLNWTNSTGAWPSLGCPNVTVTSSASIEFTKWSVLAGGEHIYASAPFPTALQNCQFYSGVIAGQNNAAPPLSVTNCLFWRVICGFSDAVSSNSETFYNNLFWNGSLNVVNNNSGTYTFRDNLFDSTLITNKNGATINFCSNNAYVTGFTTLLPTNSNVTLSASPAYQTGPLGQYYYPTSLTSLIFKGSQYASNAALYHFAVTTNANSIDGINVVSIGFHYVGVGTNTLPLDANNDGLADYLEDPSGTGAPGPWTSTNVAPFFGFYGVQPINQSAPSGSPVTFSETVYGTPPLSYQWWLNGTIPSDEYGKNGFNGFQISGATSSNYTISSVQFSNQGNYSVIITNQYGSVTSAVSTLALPVNVTNDLLLIYNSNSAWLDSSNVCAYYLANRPMVSGCTNIIGVNCSNYTEQMVMSNYNSEFSQPISTWLTLTGKRPQYVILFPDLPSIVANTSGTATSVQFDMNAGVNPVLGTSNFLASWHPFVTSINMNGTGGTNDCVQYINKLANIGSNYSPGKLIISAYSGGYGNTNYYFDDCRTVAPGYPTPGSNASSGVLSVNPSASITYSNVYGHDITNGINVAGYLSWGAYAFGTNAYATNGDVEWTNNSGWWLIRTVESYNGRQVSTQGEGTFLSWFASNAFGGTTYSHTPVAAISTVDEPSEFGTYDGTCFGLWESGNNFAVCAWSSQNTNCSPYNNYYTQAVGDPFVCK
jgi:hypothetical protein